MNKMEKAVGMSMICVMVTFTFAIIVGAIDIILKWNIGCS